MRQYIISPSATRDLNEIADYFLEHNLDVGENLLREFDQKCKNLAQFPNMGRSYAHLKPFLRGLPLDGYIILYRVMEDKIEILRVINGRRDLDSLFAD